MFACKIYRATELIINSFFNMTSIFVLIFLNQAKIDQSNFEILLAFNPISIKLVLSLEVIKNWRIAYQNIVRFEIIINVTELMNLLQTSYKLNCNLNDRFITQVKITILIQLAQRASKLPHHNALLHWFNFLINSLFLDIDFTVLDLFFITFNHLIWMNNFILSWGTDHNS